MPNKVTLIYDRVTKNLQTFAGNPVPAPMQPGGAIEVFQGDRILLNLRVVETLSAGASQTAVDLTSPSSPTAMRLNVRAARSSTAAQYAFADTYNEGFEATNENLSTGRVTWSLSFDNAALDTALAAESNDYVVAHADFVELRTINSVQFPTTLFALTFKIYKQVDGGDVETHSGTAQAGGASTITLESGASTTDDIFNGFYILITGGTGAGQERTISDYVGSTLVATVSSAWSTQPDSSSTYRIRASRFSTTVLTDAEVVQRTPEVQTFSGNDTLAAANGIGTVYCSGSPTLTLPSAASYSRMGYIIINTDGGTTTLNRAGSDTINSAATSYSVVGNFPALIARDTSSHWLASHATSSFVTSARTLTAGDGLQGGGDLSANRTFNIDVSDFAGTGLEDDGSENLRLATQGNGIAGGNGSTLSVQPDSTTGGNIIPVSVGANGVGVDETTLTVENLTAGGTDGQVLTSAGDGTSAWEDPTGGMADPGGNGIVVRTAENVTTNRTLTAGDGIAVTNGSGVAGNPTVAADINGATDRTAFASGDKLLIYEDGVGIRKIDYDDLPGAGGGEANTASNVGTSGVGVFKQKSVADLELYKLLGSAGVSVALDGTDKIDVKANISGLTADASPDVTADYVMTYDDSASTNKKVLLGTLSVIGTPSADHSASGPTTESFNAGESVSAFELVYLKSDGEWWRADASAASTAAGTLGIALAAGTDGNPMSVALHGSFVRDDTWNWTAGATLYMSLTTGAITETAPSATDEVVRVIGFAASADVIHFVPSSDYLTVV